MTIIKNIVPILSLTNYYFLGWLMAMIIASILIILGKALFCCKEYWNYIFAKWKIITFILSTIALCVIAPISNDPTWYIPETIIMCTLTFITAPWVIGMVYRFIVGYERIWRDLYIAICLWLFSSSWSYDLYVWIWQGHYPESWVGNLMISPILYLCAGAFWSLEYRKGKGVVFAFRESWWLLQEKQDFKKLFWYTIPFVLLGVAIFGGFLYINI